MYFSKNSRYVLQKAQILSPTLFKATEKNLSVKTPSDDPSKPPLRINIPKDVSPDDAFQKRMHSVDGREGRSRSFTSGPLVSPIASTFEEGFLQKCESEMHFPNFVSDTMLMNDDLDHSSAADASHRESSSLSHINNKEDYSDGLRTTLQEEATANALSSSYLDKEPLLRRDIKTEPKSTEADEDKPKSIYIIIDVPENGEGKSLDSKAETHRETRKLPLERDDFEVFSTDAKKQKMDRQRSALGKGGKILQKIPFLKGKQERTKRFEIDEVEDAATYVFHFKLNNRARNPSKLGRVPEKEVRVRNENLNLDDGPIRISDSAARATANPRPKQAASLDELPNSFKHQNANKKHKPRKSEEAKASAAALSQLDFPSNEFEDTRPPQRRMLQPAHFREERRNPLKFERDDFGAIRTAKNYPFRLPGKASEARLEESQVQEEAQAELPSAAEAQAELSSAAEAQVEVSSGAESQMGVPSREAANPEGQAAKVEISTHESPYLNISEVRGGAEEQRTEEPVGNTSPYLNINELKKEKTIHKSNANDYTKPSKKQMKEFGGPQEETKTPPYLNISEVEANAENQRAEEQSAPESVETTPPYFSIHDLKEEKTSDKSNADDHTKPSKKLVSEFSSSEFGRGNGEAINFQTCVSIQSEKVSCRPTKFCAAFPPLLSEALKNRFKFRKPNFFEEKLGISLKSSKSLDDCSKSSKVDELLENSILFPKKECEEFDCESLFTTREEVILNLIKNSEQERKTSGVAKKPAKHSNEGSTEKLYSDSLTVMKKVKEIVQFDLDNVVKIFSDGKPKEVSSVVISNGDGWKIDSEELEKQFEKTARRLKNLQEKKDLKEDVLGDKIEGESHPFKYLPTTMEKTKEMKLSDDGDSVITFDPKTNEFFIKKDALAEAIARKTNESVGEVSQTLDSLAKIEAKSGDSILVFDDETQSWKVDFSILERREEQMKIEEELTKRSEMILETIEQLEKGKMTSVPLPETREKRTFDYKNEQWNAYNSDKKSKDRSKSPFRESDAEEIRKQNSDLYENLFIANKKQSTKTEKAAPGLNPSKSPKKSRAWLLAESKEQPGNTPQQGQTPLGPEPPKPDSKPPAQDKQTPAIKDDNFWESFLNMNILPRDIKEIPKLPPTPKPPPGPPSSVPPVLPPTKIDGSLPETPSKKIEEPKFKIRIPFIKDKKIEKEEPPVSKGDSKGADEPGKKPPAPTSGAGGARNEKSGVKAPPSTSSQSKEGPAPSKKPPTIGSPKSHTETKSEIKAPSGSTKADVQEPKSPVGGKTDKSASGASDHYVSDKIIEISRNKSTDNQPKIKANKIETVKLNITSDTRLPSKVTEINLSKKAEEKAKETTATTQSPPDTKTPSDSAAKKNDQSSVEKKTLQKTFEKYKTPYGEPDYEEKSMKIKSDMESNPNLKKLDNWSKTLVLHDIMKPPENIESWLKDETDKMATLLLKVLQEAADGKPKKKQPLNKGKNEKQAGKANPYDNIRKKQETTPENFLFRVRTVNVSLENDKKKPGENMKLTIKSEQLKDVPVQSEKAGKPSKAVDGLKTGRDTVEKDAPMPMTLEDSKSKASQTALETAVESAVMSKELSQMKLPFEITEEIPGPEILKKISNTWKMFPILGSQMTIFTLLRVFQLVNLGSSILGSSNPDKTRRHAFTKLFLKYGPIVNVQGPLSGNVILIHSPEHLTGVFEQDLTTSVRSVFDSLEQSRREAEENGFSVGISTDWSKPEWNDLKRESVDPLLKGSAKYFGLCDAAGESLVSNIRKNRNSQNFVSDDFMDDIRRWSLEGLCSVIFEKSFGFLEGRTNGANWILEPDKLYLAIEEATSCLSKCERGFQMWRLMSTPSAMGLGRAYRNISSILSKQLYQAEINLKSKGELVKSDNSLPVRDLTFVESMLLNDGMTTDEITCNLVDMILIGTNAMNSALGFLLYNLAQNIKVQMKLLRELKEVLPTKDTPLNYNKVTSLKYLQACLKETLRLHFPVPVFYRLLQNDILLANYIVPKGTFVVMDYRVSSMKEQVYDDPDKFVPERWLMDEQWLMNNHPFGAFPLCHGPRAELAKKVVELQLLTCVAKLIRNFQVEYQFGEIQGTDAIISIPDKPLKLNFIEREL